MTLSRAITRPDEYVQRHIQLQMYSAGRSRCCRGVHISELNHRPLHRHTIILQLFQLSLVFLHCLFLILCNELVEVGTTMAGTHVVWRGGVNESGERMLACWDHHSAPEVPRTLGSAGLLFSTVDLARSRRERDQQPPAAWLACVGHSVEPI